MSGTPDGTAGGTVDGAEGLLAEALGYVAAWRGRTVAVKVGGSVLAGGMPTGLAGELALLHRAGVRTVVVHGGGPEVSGVVEKMGGSPEFVDGLRVTDRETMDAVVMVLAGRVNKRVVLRLQEAGVRATGVAGVDAGLLRVRAHPDAERLGRVGRVDRVDPSLPEALLGGDFLPVVAPVGTDGRGRTFNVNADAAAAALAAALGAEKLVLVTDVAGILQESGDGAAEPISTLSPGEARGLVAEGVVSSGMVPKVEACLAALDGGVGSAHVVGGGTEHAVLRELLTDRGAGTMIRAASADGADDEAVGGPRRAAGTGP